MFFLQMISDLQLRHCKKLSVRNFHFLFHKKYSVFGIESYFVFFTDRNKTTDVIYTVINFL